MPHRHLVFVLLGLLACNGERSGPEVAEDGGGARPDGAPGVSDAGNGEARSDGGGSDGGGLDGGEGEPDAGPPIVLTRTNPVASGNHADPHVLRVIEDGAPVYYLTATAGTTGDIRIHRSTNLVDWERAPKNAFDRSWSGQSSIQINEYHYCHIWAPHMAQVSESVFLLNFSAVRYATPQTPCPGYRHDGGIYLASASSPLGPFAPSSRDWEPLRLAPHPNTSNCPRTIFDAAPKSVNTSSPNCQGGPCNDVPRLDSDVFRDPADGRWWITYAWFTNTPPVNAWERANGGEHSEVIELDMSDPFTVSCANPIARAGLGNPHDAETLARLRDYCPRCDEMLSMRKGRNDEDMVNHGHPWGVVEAPSLFRRNGYVYALMSGSAWDSSYYHVFWVAAPSVQELHYENANRLVGRYIIPSNGMSFGHGTPVLGPDGETWYFAYHRLRADVCRTSGDCSRDLWLSEISFEDRGDGRGDVYITPIFPAEASEVQVVVRR